MAHWEKWQCRGCGVVISNSKERRKLDHAINQAGRRMSTDLQWMQTWRQANALTTRFVSERSRSYLCRKSCFASLDKIINHEKNIAELTVEVKQIRQDFLKNVERLYPPIADLEMGTDPSTAVLHPPSAKRQCTTSRAVMAGCARPRTLFSSSRSLQLTTHTTVTSPRVTMSKLNVVDTPFRNRQRKLVSHLHVTKAGCQHFVRFIRALEWRKVHLLWLERVCPSCTVRELYR